MTSRQKLEPRHSPKASRVPKTEDNPVSRFECLLGRKLLQLDLTSARKQIRGKVVAVTGAAGSIGSELCRQILNCGPSTLFCIDQSETGVFYLQRELATKIEDGRLIFCVCDFADGDRLRSLFRQWAPSIVFHAAAYKHVLLMEQNACSAVKNNVFNFLDFLDVVRQGGCERLVFISSDKAVNPMSIMGATKRIGELIVASQVQDSPCCISVRFGNVMFSSGSVLEIFERQLRDGRVLTITHPETRRFFMSPQEAVSLLLQALVAGEHRDILVLETGEPMRIVDLAHKLAGFLNVAEQQISMEFTGLREGEKLTEEVYYAEEKILPTEFPNIKRVVTQTANFENLSALLEELRFAVYENDMRATQAAIQKIVPQYSSVPGNSSYGTSAHLC
jgi:FlaA1/EpsC-like NDP-sugar epimerase